MLTFRGDYPGDSADGDGEGPLGGPGDLGLDLPAGWTAVVDEGWPEVVFALESSGELEGLFIPLEPGGGEEVDGADHAGVRAVFRRALEELRRLVGERVGARLRLQTGPVRVVSEGEYRQELSGSAFGAAADGTEAPEGGAGERSCPREGCAASSCRPAVPSTPCSSSAPRRRWRSAPRSWRRCGPPWSC